MEYQINKRKLPHKKDDLHNKMCIVKAINEHFGLSAELLNVNESKYNGYYQELEELKYIKKIGKDYRPEDYNATEVGLNALKKAKASAEVSLNLGLFTLKVGVSNK